MNGWLRGQVDLKAGVAILASIVALGSTFWGAAASFGAKDQRLAAVELKLERMESALERIEDRLPPKRK